MPDTYNGDVRLYYEEVGSGPPVLWLQGLGADHTAWTAQVIYFSRMFRCILPDSRDTGRSDAVSQPYDTVTLAGDALGVLDAAGIESAHVVGLSMGAAIAQELALCAPHRVRSLVLLSAFARADARMLAITSLWPELHARLGRVWFYRQAEPWLFSPAFFEHPSNLRPLRRYIEEPPHAQSTAAFSRQVQALHSHNTLERLPLIQTPTLVVHGEQDLLVPVARGKELAEGIANSRWEVRPGVAHSVNLEQQTEFNRLLRDFLVGIS